MSLRQVPLASSISTWGTFPTLAAAESTVHLDIASQSPVRSQAESEEALSEPNIWDSPPSKRQKLAYWARHAETAQWLPMTRDIPLSF